MGDLRVENDRTSILLSWSPPFSLDVTGVDPDVWYTVNISNVTDEDNTMEVPCANCHNLIHPSYTFTTANPSPSHKFSFTILSLNGAGLGNISEPVVGAFVEGKWLMVLVITERAIAQNGCYRKKTHDFSHIWLLFSAFLFLLPNHSYRKYCPSQ